MSERWKMNRIGFVNFWLYDDEDFELEDENFFCVVKMDLANQSQRKVLFRLFWMVIDLLHVWIHLVREAERWIIIF